MGGLTVGMGRVKQLQSCAKAMKFAVTITSGNFFIKKIKREDVDKDIKIRLDAVKRRYGFADFLEVAPSIISIFKASPKIKMNLVSGQGGKIKEDVVMKFQALIDYYEELNNPGDKGAGIKTMPLLKKAIEEKE